VPVMWPVSSVMVAIGSPSVVVLSIALYPARGAENSTRLERSSVM
jgi:hypothetical protein